MPRKTRKNNIQNYAKKGTQLSCKMKSCKAKKYASIYGSNGGCTRSPVLLFY
jgi:hypothetical protein